MNLLGQSNSTVNKAFAVHKINPGSIWSPSLPGVTLSAPYTMCGPKAKYIYIFFFSGTALAVIQIIFAYIIFILVFYLSCCFFALNLSNGTREFSFGEGRDVMPPGAQKLLQRVIQIRAIVQWIRCMSYTRLN